MSDMRLVALDVCPRWLQPDGSITLGMNYDPGPHDCDGWSIVAEILLGGETYQLLLNLEALVDEDDPLDMLDEW